MRLPNFALYQTLVSATLTGAIVMVSGFDRSARANTGEPNLSEMTKLALTFQSPPDAAPASSIGGGVRGSVQFQAPGEAAPRTSQSGGVRGSVQFQAPGEAAPRTSQSGGVRGDVQFQAPGEAAPRTSQSGGVRGNDSPPLTALLPDGQNGRTVSSHPTFFVYVPPTDSTQAFFSIQDEQGNALYHSFVTIPPGGGTVAIALPEDAPELEVGKNYLWMFAPVEPNGLLRPDNYNVVGWVKRVEPATGNAATSPLEQAKHYAQAGIWYDTLEILVSAQQQDPENETLAREWQDLLKQVGLEKVAAEPIVQRL